MPINPTKPSKIDLSIVIISYNTKKITQECLRSVFQSLASSTNNLQYEIIVVDNASTDGSMEMLRDLAKEKPNLILIENNKNVGFAKANNQGVKSASGDRVLFLNSDIIVLNQAIPLLYDFYRKHQNNIDFIGGKLLNKDLSPQPSCGPFYTLPVVFAALFLRGDYWGLTRYSPDKLKRVDWISGACILTKKNCFEAIGGFDEQIFMYMDEVDLLYRAKKRGYKTFFYPQTQFIHLGSASSAGRTYPILQVFKGLLYFYRKYYNTALSIFFLKIMLKLKALTALLIGRLTNNQYLVKTYAEAYKLAKMA